MDSFLTTSTRPSRKVDVNELLRIPEERTATVVRDAAEEILREEMQRSLEANLERLTKAGEERKLRRKANAILRDRLEAEVNQERIQQMFQDNYEYLCGIKSGAVESQRHRDYHASLQKREALRLQMIMDPFTEDQLDWALEEIAKVWMKDKAERLENNEYVWKVLLPECLIKFYMDFFGIDKKEAETKIRETPLREKDDFRLEGDSSEEDRNSE